MSVRVNLFRPEPIAQQLDARQQRFPGDQFQGQVKPAYVKTIHMIFQQPVFQAVHHQPRIGMGRKIEFQDQFDARPVQSLHQILTLFSRILSPGKRSLGCKIEARAIAPAVLFIMMLLFFGTGKIGHGTHRSWQQLAKLIYRLQLQHIDAQCLQIRDPFYDPCKGPLLFHPGAGIHGQMPHVTGIQNGILIGNLRCTVTVPVVSVPDKLPPQRPRFPAEYLPPADASGSRITELHAVQKKGIGAVFGRQRLQSGKVKIADAVFFCKIQLAERRGFAGMIKA